MALSGCGAGSGRTRTGGRPPCGVCRPAMGLDGRARRRGAPSGPPCPGGVRRWGRGHGTRVQGRQGNRTARGRRRGAVRQRSGGVDGFGRGGHHGLFLRMRSSCPGGGVVRRPVKCSGGPRGRQEHHAQPLSTGRSPGAGAFVPLGSTGCSTPSVRRFPMAGHALPGIRRSGARFGTASCFSARTAARRPQRGSGSGLLIRRLSCA